MSEEPDNDFKSVAEFIEHETGYRADCVTLGTALLGDIGLDGEDAEDFFLSFSKRFGVAMDELNLDRHFGGEGFAGASILAWPIKVVQRLLGRDAHTLSGLQPIRVEQLVRAVKSGHWTQES